MNIEVKINGKKYKANAGEMLINVADREGIYIPRFCYHKQLSIVANCRMCLVEIEGMAKPMPACATPVDDGMSVSTKSEKTLSYQKNVMEFLLINHPLDCPICDQAGECELQDISLKCGAVYSSFKEKKRVVADKDISPLIHTQMTRCIHCTRCVRFGEEIAGVIEMGSVGRGENTKIEPFLDEGVNSELSGNIIDICPVGALVSKPYSYEFRSWQTSAKSTIARHDLIGSNIYAHTFNNKVKRIVAKENAEINDIWISDRDRFSYEALESENRLLVPQIKNNGKWEQVSWDKALDFTFKGLANILEKNSPKDIGGLISASSTLEELYLFKKLLTGLGSNNIDHRFNRPDIKNFISPSSSLPLQNIENKDFILIIGGNPRLEQPMLNYRVRKAALNGAEINVINHVEFDFNYDVKLQKLIAPQDLESELASLLKALLTEKKLDIFDYLNDIKISDSHLELVKKLICSKSPLILLANHVSNNSRYMAIYKLTTEIADIINADFIHTNPDSNSIAALASGVIPQQKGLNTYDMFLRPLKSYLLFDVYPEFDFFNSSLAIKILEAADFVISFNSFYDAAVYKYSNVILPIASFFETSGTHININNKSQYFKASVKAPHEAKPGWKVLKVLADLFELKDFDYIDTKQISEEAQNAIKNKLTYVSDYKLRKILKSKDVSVIRQLSPYAKDILVRNAKSLQETKIGKINIAMMNSKTAKILNVTDSYKNIPIKITDNIAKNCVFIYYSKPFKEESNEEGKEEVL